MADGNFVAAAEAAFAVLLMSEMPPLQQFGTGLAIGLVGAALGAVGFTPMLVRDPPSARSPAAAKE